MSNLRVIAHIKGGLGNQLFCYAAARRLALVNQAELVIDDVNGFACDVTYQRQYSLHRFNIAGRPATAKERLEPFEWYKRKAAKFLLRVLPFERRPYLVQEGRAFDPRLLTLQLKRSVYLDGYWQSERYFKDIEKTIRGDFVITAPSDNVNRDCCEKIRCEPNAIALHVRWFKSPSTTSPYNASLSYYQRAIAFIKERVPNPHFFLFSDDVDAARQKLNLDDHTVTYITHNQGDANAYADLWLMVHCKHFIIANSTFSWWGAWLAKGDAKSDSTKPKPFNLESSNPSKIVITPNLNITGITSWGFDGLIPDDWIVL